MLYKLFYVTIFIHKTQLIIYKCWGKCQSYRFILTYTNTQQPKASVLKTLPLWQLCLSHTNCYTYSFVTVMSASSNFSTSYTHHCLLPLWPPWRKQRKETPAQKRTDFMLFSEVWQVWISQWSGPTQLGFWVTAQAILQEQDCRTKNASRENPARISGLGEGIYCHTIFRLGVIQKIESHVSGRCYLFPWVCFICEI